jgi:hypothetical protein
MLTLFEGRVQIACERREFLRAGAGLAVAGLWLPQRLRARPVQTEPTSLPPLARGGARSCILVYLLGGPPHLDMFDLKPEAPTEYRGEFKPIATNAPGVLVCEHLPRLARQADRYALVRSVSHRNSNHTPMIYYTLTGRHTEQPERDNDIRPPQRTDFPHLGAVVARFKGSGGLLPGYVALPELAIRSSLRGEYKRARTPLRGGGGGFLGPQVDPLAVTGEPGTPEAIPALTLPRGVTPDRFGERSELLTLLEQRGPSVPEMQGHSAVRQRAVVLTGSSQRGPLRAFALDGEPAPLRERYGRHRFGQSLLLARRLTEAGVPLVAIHFNEMTVCDGWDTHSKNFEALKGELLPLLDQSLSALLDDLDQRGRLQETLVVCMGEFGRTPKINPNAGRDHWGECSAVLLAGGGIRGGQVLGSSDKHGAFPRSDPVDPVDIQATLYHCLGLDPRWHILDQARRPWEISTGKVLEQLL